MAPIAHIANGSEHICTKQDTLLTLVNADKFVAPIDPDLSLWLIPVTVDSL